MLFSGSVEDYIGDAHEAIYSQELDKSPAKIKDTDGVTKRKVLDII